jgi:3-deoxy-D-manno-octulosonic-acid transferase
MRQILYNTLLTAAAPAAACWLRHHPQYRPLLNRFNPPVPGDQDRPLQIQACSLGEVNTALPVIEALSENAPGLPLLLTVSTIAGHARAMEKAGIPVTWLPFDTPRAVRRFLNQSRPRALVLVETEIWPNIIRETRRRGAPVIIINGRLSDKHCRRYRRARFFYRPIMRTIDAIGVQNGEYARRFEMIGADPARIHITGNTKFDAVATAIDARTRTRLRAEHGFTPDTPVLLFGSTRPGDETLALGCWRSLRKELPDLKLIIAPRHTDRAAEIRGLFSEPVICRSEIRKGCRPGGERVLLLDTMGEMAAFYAIASIAVIGGSFFPGVNGHNPLEAAALGIPTVFGPYMSNFPEPARVLTDAHGAIQIHDPGQLYPVLRSLLHDPAERRHLGTRARKAVLDGRGAVAKNTALILDILKNPVRSAA